MFREEFDRQAGTAKTKIEMLSKNPIGYFALAVFAGIYIGFGVILAFTIGGLLGGAAWTKIAMGLAFGIALSLVVIAGAELFTGNNLVMAAGMLKKEVSISAAVKLWAVCYLGNWLGALIISVMYHFTDLASEPVAEFMASSAAAKMSVSFVPLLLRAILCNILVCLAVWCAGKCRSESAKLIMIFWCLFAFITSGFEHSIANMTLLTIGLLEPAGQAVSIGGYFYNLAVVTVGNMIGGIVFVALPYFAASRRSGSEKR